jgi:glycerophosphoryl diester phosphodiesterase
MAGLDWLIARPVAHRGLHDASAGIIENTAGAVQAAIDAGFAIEVDLQLTADGEAVVFHDETLDRLTDGTGPLAARTAADLKAVAFKACADRIQTLSELLDQVAGRVPLLIEIKGQGPNLGPLERRAAELVSAYPGPAALMSFDTRSVALIRRLAPGIVRGIVAERFDDPAEWPDLTLRRRLMMRHLVPALWCRPHFIAYHVKALPAAAPMITRALGLPLLTWTVRTAADRATAVRWADQMIFEGFRP